jgi:hypothetical protein
MMNSTDILSERDERGHHVVPSRQAPIQSAEEMQAELARLRAHVAATERTTALRCKVSEKGAVSVYGLGRFPVTLYKEQWARLLGDVEAIKDFIARNEDRLKSKGE